MSDPTLPRTAFDAWRQDLSWTVSRDANHRLVYEAFCAGWEASASHTAAAIYGGHDVQLAIEAARRAERQSIRDRVFACQVAVQLPHVGDMTGAVLISDLRAILLDGAS